MDLHEFRTPAVSCQPGLSLAEAAAKMDSHGVGSLVVVDEGGGIVGIVTDRDIAIRGIAKESPPSTQVSEVMTRDVTSLSEDADLFDVASRMASTECRRMPVVDANGTLTGVVSLDDLMVLFTRQTDHLVQVMAAEQATR
jgi:signal-transduction protein with cAMP-binding, CBS, and nucleotidyltransferase domain